MHWWILFLTIGLLFAYLFAGFAIRVLSNFWYHDFYDQVDICGALAAGKTGRPSWIPRDSFVIDMHAHTTASDGLLTPRQLVCWEIANGYDGVVVSDHNTMESVESCKQAAAELDPDFLVIPGMEFTALNVHMNLVGIKTPGVVPNMLWTRRKTIKRAIDHAHSEGGVVQFNHPDWYFFNVFKKYPRDWWMEQDIDGWEVYNGFGFFDEDALNFIENHGDIKIMYASAGTDVHDPAKHLRCYTEILTTDRTEEGVLAALKAGKTKVHLHVDQERERVPPERGKIHVSPERQEFIRKWIWIYWVGDALIMGNRRKLLAGFLASVILFSIFLAIFT